MINKKNIFILFFILNLLLCKNIFAYYYIDEILIEKNISLITKNFNKSTEDIKKLIKKYNIYEKDYTFSFTENKKISIINLNINLENYNSFIKDIENLNYIKLLSKEEVFLDDYIEKIKNIQKEKLEYKKEIENKINSCELIYIDLQIELCKLETEIEEVGKLLEKKDKYINCKIYLEENNKKEITNNNKINKDYNIMQKTILLLVSMSYYFLFVILLLLLLFIIKKIKKAFD